MPAAAATPSLTAAARRGASSPPARTCSTSARSPLYSDRSTEAPPRPPPEVVARLRLLDATLPAGESAAADGSASAGQGERIGGVGA